MPRTLVQTAPVFDGADASSDQASAAVNVESMLRISFVCTVSTGTSPTGTFALQVSNDPPDGSNTFAPTRWVQAQDASATRAVSNNGSFVVACDGGYRWARVTWTFTSGTGSITAYAHAVGA